MAFQERRDSTPHTVAGRVLTVLEVFEAGNPALTLSEISHRAGLPLSTTHRIVTELTSWGALERHPDRRYTIGWRLVELAALIQAGRRAS